MNLPERFGTERLFLRNPKMEDASVILAVPTAKPQVRPMN